MVKSGARTEGLASGESWRGENMQSGLSEFDLGRVGKVRGVCFGMEVLGCVVMMGCR